MNKLTLMVAALSVCATSAFAQKAKVNAAENCLILKKYDEAKQNIDAALANPKTENDPNTYIVASRVEGQMAADGKGGDINKAREYFEKAITLDSTPDAKGKTGKAQKDIAKEYSTFANNAINFGVRCFETQDYKGAEAAFINANWANSMKPGYTDASDSLIIYNAAIAAMQAEDYETAVKFFDKTVDVDYEGPMSVLRINYCYQQMKASSDKMESNLKKGFEKYPANKDVLTTLIQYYLNEQRNEEALAYLNEAIDKDNSNARYYFARGCLNEKINIDNAIKDYETAIAKDSELFIAYFNLAVVYYNQGVEKFGEANNERDQKKYNAMIGEANEMFKKSLPYMEKAATIADTVENKKQCLETVKSIYYRLGDYDKSQAVADQIKTL